MPIRLAAGDGDADQIGKKNALNAQPYSSIPPSSFEMAGSTVATASASNAAPRIVKIKPMVSQRWSEPQIRSFPVAIGRLVECTLLALTGDRIHVVVSHATPRSSSAAARELYRSRKQSSSPGGTVRHLAFRSGAIRAYTQNDANHSSFRRQFADRLLVLPGPRCSGLGGQTTSTAQSGADTRAARGRPAIRRWRCGRTGRLPDAARRPRQPESAVHRVAAQHALP